MKISQQLKMIEKKGDDRPVYVKTNSMERRSQKPEVKAKKKAYMKAYQQRPEYKAYQKAYKKAYNQRPERKAYMKAYYQRKKKELGK